MKQKLAELKGEIDKSTTIMGDFNIQLPMMGRTTSQKINKEIDLNNSIKQLDITDIYRKLHSIMTEYIFFSIVYGIFSRTNHMLGHKKVSKNLKGLK